MTNVIRRIIPSPGANGKIRMTIVIDVEAIDGVLTITEPMDYYLTDRDGGRAGHLLAYQRPAINQGNQWPWVDGSRASRDENKRVDDLLNGVSK